MHAAPMRPIESAMDQPFAAETRRANRRRLRVFLGVFLVVAVVGLAWNFLRPAEYRATARLQITPPSTTLAPAAAEGASPDGRQQFLNEVQTLSSRPVIEQVAEQLRGAGHDLSRLGLDPVLALQSAMTVNAVEGTQVVELAAVGSYPELPAALLEGVTGAYRDHLARSYEDSTAEAVAGAAEEVTRLEAAVAAKRRAVEDFRVRNNIVSPEREENSILAEMQGMAAAQKDTQKKLLDAEAKVEALRAAAAEGKSPVRARDNPTLAGAEARASQLREELRELGRRYTPDYLDMDPNARAMRARLAELEEQIRTQRAVGQKTALDEAEQDLAAAREASRRLQQQQANSRERVSAFASRFAHYKSLQEELVQLEKTYHDAMQRQARLGATERSRMPVLQVLEHAVIDKQPWRPLYWRDAGIILGAALLLGLAAMWLVELFNRPAPTPSVLVTQPVLAGTLLPGQALPEIGGESARRQLDLDSRPRLAAPAALPRELTTQEAAALLAGADADARRAAVLLLCGLSPDEARQLRWSDVDAAGAAIEVAGAHRRQVAVPAPVLARLGAPAAADAPVLCGADGEPVDAAALAASLLVAAHDAGIEQAQQVTPEALRHTYLAFLVRQGARFADITRWVGPLAPEALSAYSPLAPAGVRAEAQAVQRLYPALAPTPSA
jgi:uncharacterized protein involved in exopolysaccharide biosynthesis